MIHIHIYHTVLHTGLHSYGQCRCGKRRVRRFGCCQPVDRQWVETGEWEVLAPPPPPSRPLGAKPQ